MSPKAVNEPMSNREATVLCRTGKNAAMSAHIGLS